MPTSVRLPPPDVSLFELLQDYPRCLAVRLFTNELPADAEHTLGMYQEPTFPGYSPASIANWNVNARSAEGRLTILSTVARWRLGADISPLIIRGWFITALFADDVLALLTEFTASAPVIIAAKGQVIISPITLKVFVVDVP